MKKLKTALKNILYIYIIGCITGCATNPIPAAAIQSCLDAGGTPDYFSNYYKTGFTCIKTPSKKI